MPLWHRFVRFLLLGFACASVASLLVLFAMAVAGAASQLEWVAQLTDEMRHLLDARKINIEIQAAIAELGLTTVNMFALLGDDVKMVRESLAAPPFNLDPDAEGLAPALKLKKRVDQAKVLDAWEGAKARAGEKHKSEAVQRASNLPLTLACGDQVTLRRFDEAIFGKAEEASYPATCVIERRMQEVEQGNSAA